MKIKSRLIAHIFVRRGSTYVKPKPKQPTANSNSHIFEYISAAKMLHFCDICL